MAPFDLSLVGKNLQTFKGTYKYLEEFLTQVEILHDLIDDEDRVTFVKYVYNFKLTTQVRGILGRSNRPTTFVELKRSLEDAYPNPKTLQQVLSELGAAKQQSSSIAEFREKITTLTNDISIFEIANLTNPTQEMKDVVYKLSDSMALNTFLRGVNGEYQQILLSNIPKSLNEAVERCMTAERTFNSERNTLYHINRSNNGNRNNQRFFNGNRNNNNNDGNNYNNNFVNNTYNRNNNNNDGNNYNNNFRNNTYNRSGNYNNFRNNTNDRNGSYSRNNERCRNNVNNYNRNNNRSNFNGNNGAQYNFNRNNSHNPQNNNNNYRNTAQRGNNNRGN